jgi:hypothetical protein
MSICKVQIERHSDLGCGAKIIFPQFDTIVFAFACHYPGDEND